ncbi:hypothetical protein [Streptomyces erythrochromogenes]|uniref:hypothetical protein n=1 Tax=Streptomyces erythrochromogenes TaxID=285574 RepID=UPI0037D13CC9
MSTAAQHPHLTVVPPMPTAAPAPLEGVVVKDAPVALRSEGALARAVAHARQHHGYAPLAGRGYRRIAARWLDRYHDDYPHMIATARGALGASADVAEHAALEQRKGELRQAYKRHRLIYSTKTGMWATTALTAAGAGTLSGGWWVSLATLLGTYAYGVRHGITDEATQLPPHELTSPMASPGLVEQPTLGMSISQLPDDARPFPLAQAHSANQLAHCVLAALRAENIPVAEVFDITRQVWGWQCTIRVSEGTPEAVIKAAGGLETRFDLGDGGVRPQPLKSRRSCAILRLVQSNPFASAPGLPYRAPHSLSITDKTRIGTSVGGDPLELALSGVMGLVVASSGGGKTGLLQALAEVTTACRDNITIDLDPHGDGLEDLGDAVRITGRTHEQIEAVLYFFLMLSKARARLRAPLGMGKKWVVSPEHPHFTIFFDEFPKGSELAKALAMQLLLVGRKEAVTLLIASQGATKFYLGESFAQMVALKVVGPCKVGDTRGVFGDGAVAEGWLPHRLAPATDVDPKDAGHIYLQGVPGRPDEPIEYAVHETPSAALRKIAAERLDAGLLEPDDTTLKAMPTVDAPDMDDLPQLLSWPALLRLCDAVSAAGGTGTAPIVARALAVMGDRSVDRIRTEPLAEALGLTVTELKAQMRDAGFKEPMPLGEMDGMQNPRGYKRDTLTSA